MEEEQDQELGEIKALIKAWLMILLSLSYTYYIVSKLPKGKLRVFSLLPIFSLFTLLPLSLSSPTPSGLTGFFITWLANFKLLLYCFNLGPLSHDLPQKSLFKFILVASFPIKIKQISNNNNPKIAHKKIILPLTLWSRSLIYSFLVVFAIVADYSKNVHKIVMLGIYCCAVYLNLEIVMGLTNKLVGSMLGGDVALCPPFYEPYLSTSLQDFWGKRWNLMVSNTLRDTVYIPTRAFWEFRLGVKWAQPLAVMAAFVVSGLMHELLYYYITRATPTWEVSCFFLLHGLCLVVEIGLKEGLGLGSGQRWGLHWAVSGPLTIGFVMVTGFWLFFPQLVRNKVDVRSVEELKAVGMFVKGMLGKYTS